MKNQSRRLREKCWLSVPADVSSPIMPFEYVCGCRVHLHRIILLVSGNIGVVTLLCMIHLLLRYFSLIVRLKIHICVGQKGILKINKQPKT